jgi:hypothetical protein
MSEIPIWTQAALAVVGSGSLAALIHLARDLLRRRAGRLYDRGYRDISSIYQNIQGLLSDTDANRVMMLKSENGGGIPSPGCIVKSSVLYEVCDSPAKPVAQAWQLVPLDQDYASILSGVVTKGRAVIRLDDLHPQSVTHELMRASDATHSYVFRVAATPHALLYLAVQYSSLDAADPMGAEAYAATRSVLGQLGKIIARHHQLVKREQT